MIETADSSVQPFAHASGLPEELSFLLYPFGNFSGLMDICPFGSFSGFKHHLFGQLKVICLIVVMFEGDKKVARVCTHPFRSPSLGPPISRARLVFVVLRHGAGDLLQARVPEAGASAQTRGQHTRTSVLSS